jgi:hypothetical protein
MGLRSRPGYMQLRRGQYRQDVEISLGESICSHRTSYLHKEVNDTGKKKSIQKQRASR